MPLGTPPELWQYLLSFGISIITGFISISHRILNGHVATLLWVISEMITAVLCGYLMFGTYPRLENILPSWITLPVAIALASYSGGRLFYYCEKGLYVKVERFFNNDRAP